MTLKSYLKIGLLAGAMVAPALGLAKAKAPENYDSYLFVYFPSNQDENLFEDRGEANFSQGVKETSFSLPAEGV